jgi:hypothetical protein
MKPPITTIPGIPADWNAIGKSMRAAKAPPEAANDSNFKQALVAAVQEWEDEGGSVGHPETPPAKPPAKRP